MHEDIAPRVDRRTGIISAKASGMAIVRHAGGRWIGFRTAADALGHPSAQVMEKAA